MATVGLKGLTTHLLTCIHIVQRDTTGLCVVWCKANLNLQNFDEAVRDFKAVLEIDPDNKAAKNQLAITNHKVKQIHNREKQTYAGMFQKFAEIDAKVTPSSSASRYHTYYLPLLFLPVMIHLLC